MVKSGNAYKDLLTWHYIPVSAEDGENMELVEWPFLLPEDMALT